MWTGHPPAFEQLSTFLALAEVAEENAAKFLWFSSCKYCWQEPERAEVEAMLLKILNDLDLGVAD